MQKKAGHTGTLDPGAAGVLPVCVGRATKIADYIMRGDKEYIAEITFGAETDTQDSYGSVTRTCESNIMKEMLACILPDFTGKLLQRPPMYSAVKHEGRKLYQLARKGIVVEKPLREVRVHEIELLGGTCNRFPLRIRCSKGHLYPSPVCGYGRGAFFLCLHVVLDADGNSAGDSDRGYVQRCLMSKC